MSKITAYALLILLWVSSGCGERKPDIILIVLDAVRADHLSCYGYFRNTSPTLDSLAECGTMWTRVQSQAPWTLPAFASIFTGLYVHSHGVRQNLNGTFALSEQIPTAASLFSEGGYYTAAVMNSYWTGPGFGFNRDFQSFFSNDNGNGKAAESVQQVISLMEGSGSDQESFILLHLYDPHSPYFPPGGYDSLYCDNPDYGGYQWGADHEACVLSDPENLQRYTDLYDGEISWVDSQLSILFQWLRETNRAENTLVVITADHGEEFLDHGWVEHSVTLYQELLHVPLIISGPGVPSGITDTIVAGQIDILPTMLSLAGLDTPEHLEGVSLLNPGPDADRVIFSSGTTVNHWHPDGLRNRNWISARTENTKLIWQIDEGVAVTYDLSSDSDEQNPLPPDSSLIDMVMQHLATRCPYEPTPMGSPEADRAGELRGLGYI